MEARPTALLLWLRATALAAVVLGCGTVAHVGAAGRVPGPLFLGFLAAVTVMFSAALLTRPAGTGRIVALTVAGQTWVHLALTTAAGHAGDRVAAAPVARPAPRPTHRATSYLEVYESTRPVGADAAPALPSPLLHLSAELSGEQAPMMVLHLVAAALVGLWLAAGEHALWALLAALLGAYVGCRLPLLPVLGRRVAVRPLPPVRRRPRLVSRPALRRGPPALLAV